MTIILESVITCPNCGHQKAETMPEDMCQFMYQCENCATIFRPRQGDCCVYCSYGSVQCPSKQLEAQNQMAGSGDSHPDFPLL